MEAFLFLFNHGQVQATSGIACSCAFFKDRENPVAPAGSPDNYLFPARIHGQEYLHITSTEGPQAWCDLQAFEDLGFRQQSLQFRGEPDGSWFSCDGARGRLRAVRNAQPPIVLRKVHGTPVRSLYEVRGNSRKEGLETRGRFPDAMRNRDQACCHVDGSGREHAHWSVLDENTKCLFQSPMHEEGAVVHLPDDTDCQAAGIRIDDDTGNSPGEEVASRLRAVSSSTHHQVHLHHHGLYKKLF